MKAPVVIFREPALPEQPAEEDWKGVEQEWVSAADPKPDPDMKNEIPKREKHEPSFQEPGWGMPEQAPPVEPASWGGAPAETASLKREFRSAEPVAAVQQSSWGSAVGGAPQSSPWGV